MKKLKNYSPDSSENHNQIVSVTDLEAFPLDVHIIKPNSVIIDPLTAHQIRFLYAYRTLWDYQCPLCSDVSREVTMFRTTQHLIIACTNCHRFTWLKIFTH